MLPEANGMTLCVIGKELAGGLFFIFGLRD